MSDHKIDVTVFDPEVVRREVRAAARARPRARRAFLDLPTRNFLGSGLCAALIAALHTAVLVPLLAGGGAHARPHAPPLADSAQAAGQDDVLQVSFISAGPPDRSALAADIGEPALQQISVDLRSLQPPAVEAPANLAPDSGAQASADSAGDSLMAGRYMGQIDARIQRVWLRPRTSIGATSFLQQRDGRYPSL
ncbi:MAG TPA: hypothetical protein VMB48_12315 [Steroidobacteraceae bacterium]|nr:hypothetical protein [Steroidobacteraceae bacterium]